MRSETIPEINTIRIKCHSQEILIWSSCSSSCTSNQLSVCCRDRSVWLFVDHHGFTILPYFLLPLFLSFSISLLPRLVAVEDELRGGPIVEPKPRIFPDQVCEPSAAFLVWCLCCSHCLSSLPPCFDFVSVWSDCTWPVSVFLFPSIPYDGDYLLPSLLTWPICC